MRLRRHDRGAADGAAVAHTRTEKGVPCSWGLPLGRGTDTAPSRDVPWGVLGRRPRAADPPLARRQTSPADARHGQTGGVDRAPQGITRCQMRPPRSPPLARPYPVARSAPTPVPRQRRRAACGRRGRKNPTPRSLRLVPQPRARGAPARTPPSAGRLGSAATVHGLSRRRAARRGAPTAQRPCAGTNSPSPV